MLRHAFSVSKGVKILRFVATGLMAATMALANGPASAAANPRYAAIVVDANTGKTLYSVNATARRYPASLTKMMTLYLTFEAMKRGKIKKTSSVRFSSEAASQPPTKLGVRAGSSITVEAAIYSLITRSANDSSVALAELLGGSSEDFARLMTSRARSLGMSSTTFRNPNGLPNPSQFTTARDMATLGLALRRDFPQYYAYFSVRSFQYGRQRIGNHNRLLGRVKGVDGIKTGYTRASGYNLVSSVSDGNRRIVAVVMGGQSGSARDSQMTQLIREYLPKASTRRSAEPVVAQTDDAPFEAAALVTPTPRSGKNAPKPESRPEVETDDVVVSTVPRARPKQAAMKSETIVQEKAVAASVANVDAVETASLEPSGWVIQIASSPSKAEAAAALKSAKTKAAGALTAAVSYTVPFSKDGVTYYRARFSGFNSKSAAWGACNKLKQKDIGCYAVEN